MGTLNFILDTNIIICLQKGILAEPLPNYFYARHFKFLKEESVLIPVESFIRKFSKFAASNFEQINYLRTQNQKLRTALTCCCRAR